MMNALIAMSDEVRVKSVVVSRRNDPIFTPWISDRRQSRLRQCFIQT